MPATNNTLLVSWLKVLCGMVPGITQAVLLPGPDVDTDDDTDIDSIIQWPQTCSVHDDLLSAAKLAAAQNKNVTTTLSTEKGSDSVADIVIAMPLSSAGTFTGTLAILVRVKPSQQSVVMQILHWGEDWLQLLLRHANNERTEIQVADPVQPDTASAKSEKSTFLQSNRSRLITGGIIFFIIIMSVLTGTYRVTAPASLEGKIQRAIVAPFDGYIANAFIRAGETVSSGDLIAEMDSQSLILEQQRYVAEKNEHTRQYRQALAGRDKAQAHIYRSKVEQAEAQLELLEIKIQRSSLSSPLDGVVISGDLSRSLGAPVDAGDVLFEVAPLDEYRLIIFVDEEQVVDVQQGLKGVLSLTALPAEKIEFIVHKVSPVFEENVDGIAYRVEAVFNKNYPSLRPGMQGVAKIEIEQRSFAWIYLHQLYDAIRLWLWSWLP